VCERNDKPMVCESGTLVDQFSDLHRDLHEILNAGLRPLGRLRPSWRLAAAAVLVAILLATLVACGAPARGTVVEKDYAPAHTTTVCNLVGKVTVCSPMHRPEEWSIKIRSGEDEGWRSVDGETWRQIRVGQFVDFGGE